MALMFLSAACTIKPVQTEHFFRNPPTHVAEKKEIENVPFIAQHAGTCGPATLTMAMQWAGEQITQQELESKVYTQEMKGSLQTDLITASRRQGLMAVPIQGLPALIQEIDAGHPVIVFENLGLSWMPSWHYALVYGYDLPSREVIMNTGPKQHHHLGFEDFEKSWGLAGYWGLVVLPAGQLSATASEVAHVKAAAGLEQIGHKEHAAIAYQAIAKKWPQSLGARIGLANLAFAKKDCRSAVEILKATSQDHPDSAFVWHNLAVAQSQCSSYKR